MTPFFSLKKSLGQHFLIDEGICKKIIDRIPKSNARQLLEIGPGGGAITKYLLADNFWDYKAVEFDGEKVQYLFNKYPKLQNRLIQQDFLKAVPPFRGRFILVGNFPYNISGPILFKILEWENQITTVIGMFQKEVAKRVSSPPGNKQYGILSVLIGAFYQVEYLFDVSPNCFQPAPKVMSGVIKLSSLKNPHGIDNKGKFINLVKKAFGQRRKMLRNALKGFLSTNQIPETFQQKRAEQLTVENFVTLYNISCQK